MATFKTLIQDSLSSGLTARKTRLGTYDTNTQTNRRNVCLFNMINNQKKILNTHTDTHCCPLTPHWEVHHVCVCNRSCHLSAGHLTPSLKHSGYLLSVPVYTVSCLSHLLTWRGYCNQTPGGCRDVQGRSNVGHLCFTVTGSECQVLSGEQTDRRTVFPGVLQRCSLNLLWFFLLRLLFLRISSQRS